MFSHDDRNTIGQAQTHDTPLGLDLEPACHHHFCLHANGHSKLHGQVLHQWDGKETTSLMGRMAMDMNIGRGEKLESVMQSNTGIIQNLATSEHQHVLLCEDGGEREEKGQGLLLPVFQVLEQDCPLYLEFKPKVSRGC